MKTLNPQLTNDDRGRTDKLD